MSQHTSRVTLPPAAQQTNTTSQEIPNDLKSIEQDLSPTNQADLTVVNQFTGIIYLIKGNQDSGYQEVTLTRNIGSINNFGQLFSNLLKGPSYLEVKQGVLPLFELSGKSPNTGKCQTHYDYYLEETDQSITVRLCRDIKVVDQDPEYQALAKSLIKKTLDQNYNKSWQIFDQSGQSLF